jgi:hypothetical protein
LSLNDVKKLGRALFSWNASAEIKDELNIQIIKANDKVGFKL